MLSTEGKSFNDVILVSSTTGGIARDLSGWLVGSPMPLPAVMNRNTCSNTHPVIRSVKVSVKVNGDASPLL